MTNNNSTAVDLTTEVQKRLRREMLRYQVGHEIFCPACQNILDCRRAVSIDLFKADKLLRSYVRCTACYDAIRVELHSTAAATETGLEITDGRVLFTPAKRQPKRNSSPAGSTATATATTDSNS